MERSEMRNLYFLSSSHYAQKFWIRSINDHHEKIVVSPDENMLPLKGGIKHVQAWNLFNII